MKTKNVKVKVNDVKQGRIIYTAHPVYGIVKKLITSAPYMVAGIGLFAKCKTFYNIKSYDDHFSLCDSGITLGNSYNGRRSFFKLKQAEEWVNKWKNDQGFIAQHKRHTDFIEDYDQYMDYEDESDYGYDV